MASQADIGAVRDNTNEPTEATFTDVEIAAFIDASSVDAASAVVWEKKAATWAMLVDTTEAGASRKLSDLHKNALNMAKLYSGKAADVVETTTRKAGPIIKKIVRT